MLFKTKQQKTSNYGNYDIQAIVYSLPLSIVSHSDTYIYLYCQLFFKYFNACNKLYFKYI